ncbi:MAG: aspartate-alanine antiporter [Candidatus Omnitrophota bacterium]|nr:MAG: aspartate-alanine antiporter [Candidatus Omnitrophota bacterium]
MHIILDLCRSNPQIVVFLALALGYLVGKVKVFGFSLGATTGVLLVALLLGQIDIEIPAVLRSISFALFTFSIGYRVGPQFFGALKKEGFKYVLLSLIVAFTALGTAFILAKVLKFDKGTAAGFFAGSVTQSAAIGTAEGAISQLSVSAEEKSSLDTNVAVAYAITYIFGTAGGILFFKIAPRLLKIELKEEARKLQEKMSGRNKEAERPELFSWKKQLEIRAYEVENKDIAGKAVKDLEGLFPGRVAVENIKRRGRIIKAGPETVIEYGDIVVIISGPKPIISASVLIGKEVDAGDMTEALGEILDVCVLNKDAAGKSLGELSQSRYAHGVFLRRVIRQGHEIPITRDTVINKCDVLQLIGEKEDIERAAGFLGFAERPTAVTDLVMVGIGCVLGTLLGLLAVKVGGIPITLGVGGGVLVSGLIFGWLRTLHPTFGQIPSAAQWIFTNLGLNLFVACVGLGAGTAAVKAFETTGLSVFLAGIVLSLMPFVIGLFFGRKILKIHPVLLLGALAGSRVLTAALNTLQEDADSSVPVLGYAAPYAFGNVLLTIWGSVIVNIL